MDAQIIGISYNTPMLALANPNYLGPSVLVLVTLAIMLGAALWVFAMLVRRETFRRQWTVLTQWARSQGLRPTDFQNDNSSNPQINSPALKILAPHHPRPRILLEGDQFSITQILTDASSTVTAAKPIWNLLIRRIDSTWQPTGLRPTAHSVSALDLFSLSSFPSLASTQRFMLFGTDSTAARALTESGAITLLPADIGLLLHGPWLVLDFSTRKFDTIEFGRVIDLADQLLPRLQAVATPS